MKALITGASSGIGWAMAQRLAKDGHSLIVTARNEQKLLELKQSLGTSVHIIPANLSNKEECFALYQAVAAEHIDILINNAGFGVFGAFQQTNLENELEMLHVNIDALHILTKLFLQDFIKRDSGYILNVASTAAFLPGPLFSSYYATKAYVLRLTQAIYEELRRNGQNIYIGALCPGPVDTGFNNVAGVAKKLPGLPVDTVANYAVDQMYKKKPIIIPGFFMKCGVFFNKLLPERLQAKIAYNLQSKKQT